MHIRAALLALALGVSIASVAALPVCVRAHGAADGAGHAVESRCGGATAPAAGCAVSSPVVVAPGDGRTLAVVGDRIVVKLAPAPGRPGAVIEETTPPRGGPPPHEHADDDELLYVLEGRYEVRVGDRTAIADAGALAFLPRGVPHAFRNVADTPSRALVFIAPGDVVGFFERADELGARHEATPEKLAAVAGQFGLRILPPPAAPRAPALRPRRP